MDKTKEFIEASEEVLKAWTKFLDMLSTVSPEVDYVDFNVIRVQAEEFEAAELYDAEGFIVLAESAGC